MRSEDQIKITSMNGIDSYSRNENVDWLKSKDWAGLPALVGAGGTQILSILLQACGMFTPVEGGRSNYIQISGRFTRPSMYDMDLTVVQAYL